MKIKEALKKLWFIIWKDDSPKGWLLSIIFIFIFIKFIFFPLMSLITGTALPLAIVESCSMYHEKDIFGSYSQWYDEHEEKYKEFNITKEDFSNFHFSKGFNKGDILFITGVNPSKIEIGDVIIFTAPTTNPVIHRVVDIRETTDGRVFQTIGDNNNGQITFEKNIHQSNIVGKARFKIIPFIGWTKLIFYERSRSPNEKGFCNEN